jgi:hypothetical protein
MGWAEFALIPVRAGTGARLRHPIRQRDPATAIDIFEGHLFVVIDPLGVDAVIVLADGIIEGAGYLGPVHIHLHLNKVLRLRLFDTVLTKIVERFL